MASLTQWTWVWVSSGKWWRTGKPGVLQSMGLQRVGHDWTTEQQQQHTQYSMSLVCTYVLSPVNRRGIWGSKRICPSHRSQSWKHWTWNSRPSAFHAGPVSLWVCNHWGLDPLLEVPQRNTTEPKRKKYLNDLYHVVSNQWPWLPCYTVSKPTQEWFVSFPSLHPVSGTEPARELCAERMRWPTLSHIAEPDAGMGCQLRAPTCPPRALPDLAVTQPAPLSSGCRERARAQAEA